MEQYHDLPRQRHDGVRPSLVGRMLRTELEETAPGLLMESAALVQPTTSIPNPMARGSSSRRKALPLRVLSPKLGPAIRALMERDADQEIIVYIIDMKHTTLNVPAIFLIGAVLLVLTLESSSKPIDSKAFLHQFSRHSKT